MSNMSKMSLFVRRNLINVIVAGLEIKEKVHMSLPRDEFDVILILFDIWH